MPSRPNVVIVVLDTVRRDRVSCYGYERETTPALDAFAAEATRFTDPVAQAPWSIPAQASLLTGAYPSDHHGTTIRPLLGDQPTLPQLLGEAGYETYAVSSNEFVRPAAGFGRGFDEFHTFSKLTVPQSLVDLLGPGVNTITSTPWLRRPVERTFNALRNGEKSTVTGTEGPRDDGTVDRVASVLNRASDPYFLYVNLMDAHLPRSPAPDHFERFVDDDLRDVPVAANERAHVLSERELDPQQRRKLRQLYDADLRTMDDRLSRLLALLESRGDLSDSLVVLVADHGEHLGEFDLIGHQHSVFDEAVSVPLLISFPDREGRTVEAQVETRRVFHTVLDETGIQSYPERSLASGVADETAYGEFYIPMLDIGRLIWDRTAEYDPGLLGERLAFVRANGYKLVRHADEEWLFRTPERPDLALSVEDNRDVYEQLAAAVPATSG